jgi:hypothetical protein
MVLKRIVEAIREMQRRARLDDEAVNLLIALPWDRP